MNKLIQEITYTEFIKLGYDADESKDLHYFDNGMTFRNSECYKNKWYENDYFELTPVFSKETKKVEITDYTGRKSFVDAHKLLGYSCMPKDCRIVREIDIKDLFDE